MNAVDQATFWSLVEKDDRTAYDFERLDGLLPQAMQDYYGRWTTPEATRYLIEQEAIEEAEDVDGWADHEATSAVQSISLLSSRERKRAREWVTSDRSPWGTSKHGPIPDSLTITRAVAHQRKATR